MNYRLLGEERIPLVPNDLMNMRWFKLPNELRVSYNSLMRLSWINSKYVRASPDACGPLLMLYLKARVDA
jgi:hypothetical protein